MTPSKTLEVCVQCISPRGCVCEVCTTRREIELRKRVEVAQNRERSARLAMKYEEDYVRMVVVKRRQRYLCKKVFTRLMMGKTVMGFTKWVEVLHYSKVTSISRVC